MKVAHHAEIAFEDWPGIRDAGALHRTLFQGDAGSPANFEFGIVEFSKERSGSPRHKHVFDQFRFALKGDIEYNPEQSIPEGCLAYFPEGTPYGPFRISAKSVLLSLQLGGPCGQGFVHRQELGAAQKALAAEGTFDKGIYTWLDKDGKKHNEDAHKAVWTRATGGADVTMPAPRYQDPLLIFPQNYMWRAIGPLVEEKLLGVFNERNTSAKMLRIKKSGSYLRKRETQMNLYFVVDGAMSVNSAVNGAEICQKHDACRFDPADEARLEAMADTTLLVYGLPQFS